MIRALAQRLRPAGMMAQFSLLLVVTLLGAWLAALAIFAREGTDFDREARLHQDLGRLAALLHAVEHSSATVSQDIVGRSNTGYTRFSIEPRPLDIRGATPLTDISAGLRQALPGRAVLAHRPGPGEAAAADTPVLMVLSVEIREGVFAGQWLNSLVYPLRAGLAWPQKTGFWVPLIMALAGCLAVGLIFTRRLTLPLAQMARTARLAGAGDQGQRLAVSGPAELQDVARAFNTMQAQIAGFEATRRTILAAVGHDIRTPVTSLRLRAEFIEDAELRSGMIRSLDEIAVITEDLLGSVRRISDLEAPCPVDLTAMVADLAAEQGVAFTPAAPLVLPLREVAMRRALRNLMVNAVTYAKKPEAQMLLRDDQVEIILSDRGPGLSPEKLTSLSRPFEAASGGRQFAGGGAGLGLAICESVLRAHDGSLVLENRPGGGLRVTVRLPLTM